MTVPITEFVDVDVTVADAAAERFSFGNLMGIFDHSVNANRQNGPYSSLDEVVDAGFTSVAAADVHAWATAVFAQDDGVDQVMIGLKAGGDATWTATLDAVYAADPDSWYITNVDTRVEADLNLVAAWIEAHDKIAIVQSDDAGILAGTGGNIALDLQTAGYNRTALIYHDTDSEWLDGAWSSSGGGLNLDSPNGAGVWAYRRLDGVDYATITSAQAAQVFAAKANLFHRNRGLSFTSKGTMASGRFIDVTTSVDWLRTRLEEDILTAFVNAGTKIPYTSSGMNRLAAVCHSVFDRGVTYGHLSPDFPRELVVPKIASVSSSDKANRVLSLTGNVVLAGGIQKVSLPITVQV